jgi:hypothetical protein
VAWPHLGASNGCGIAAQADALDIADAPALDRFLRAAGNPMPDAQACLDRQPTLAAGYLLRLGIAVAAKDAPSLAIVDETLHAAGRVAVLWTARERAHLAAARAWRQGEPLIAAERYAAILRTWPHDLLALRLAQSCYFFLGQTSALREVVDLVWHWWRKDMPGFQYVLAMAAFACAETGESQRARALAEQALEIEPMFPGAIHTMAHAMLDAEPALAARWLQEHRSRWQIDSRMRGHIAWHLATFEVEAGNPTRALEALDHELLPASMTASGDAADATALLWRLQLDGIDVGRRWHTLSDSWAAHSSPGFWGLLDVHAAIAFHAAGHGGRASRHAAAVERLAQGGTHAANIARNVTSPALRAIEAFAAGEWQKSAGQLRVLLPSLTQLGGSGAQHEIFTRMLRHSQLRHGVGGAVAA